MTEESKTEDVEDYNGSFFHKDGQFSKTATFATLANLLVLTAYVLSWGAGSSLSFGDAVNINFPEFNAGAAVALLGIINGTYIGNNLIKSRSN